MPANDPHYRDITQPADRWEELTPNDETELDPRPRALWIGGAGNLELTGVDDVDATFEGVPVGTLLPARPKKVKATGTTATLILALY